MPDAIMNLLETIMIGFFVARAARGWAMPVGLAGLFG
jgi:hypothetical protein